MPHTNEVLSNLFNVCLKSRRWFMLCLVYVPSLVLVQVGCFALHASHAALPMVMLEISYCTSDFEMRGPGPSGW
jgi:hypothetical protein